MGRDHSYECSQCGMYRSGLNDLRCNCDPCETCNELGTPITTRGASPTAYAITAAGLREWLG